MEGKIALLVFLSLAGLTVGLPAEPNPIERSFNSKTDPAMYMYMELLEARSTGSNKKLDSEKPVAADETNPSELTTVYKANNQPIYFKSPATSAVKADQKVKYVDEAYIASKYGAKAETGATKDAYTYIVVNAQGTPIYKYVETPRVAEEATKYKYILAPKSERTITSNVYKYITAPKSDTESYKYVIVPKSEPQETKYTYKFVSSSETEPAVRYIVDPKQEAETAQYATRYIGAPKIARETSSPTVYKYIITP